MMTPIVSHGPANYQIRVKGKLVDHWSDWFAGMTIASDGDVPNPVFKQKKEILL